MNEILKDVPMGFSVAMAKNIDAMRGFSLLPENRRREIIEGTRNINSQQEMNMYVQSLINSNFNL